MEGRKRVCVCVLRAGGRGGGEGRHCRGKKDRQTDRQTTVVATRFKVETTQESVLEIMIIPLAAPTAGVVVVVVVVGVGREANGAGRGKVLRKGGEPCDHDAGRRGTQKNRRVDTGGTATPARKRNEKSGSSRVGSFHGAFFGGGGFMGRRKRRDRRALLIWVRGRGVKGGGVETEGGKLYPGTS